MGEEINLGGSKPGQTPKKKPEKFHRRSRSMCTVDLKQISGTHPKKPSWFVSERRSSSLEKCVPTCNILSLLTPRVD